MHATICDLISDLVQNSIEAGATEITLKVEENERQLDISIADNGKGMSAAVLEQAKDPFYSDGLKHKHRKVGLGIPFLFQTVEATGGKAGIESKEGEGTTVAFSLDPANVDLPMFGNFATTAAALMAYGFEGNLALERVMNGKGYSVGKVELAEALGDLGEAGNLALLKQFFETNEDEINRL